MFRSRMAATTSFGKPRFAFIGITLHGAGLLFTAHVLLRWIHRTLPHLMYFGVVKVTQR